jgi:DNA-binding beta-propeller fold protein YncE
MHRLLARTTFAVAAGLLAVPAIASAQKFTATKFDIGGAGNFDYLTADSATGRVFVSRGNRIQVVDGATGKNLGEIPNTPGTHGALLVNSTNHGFTTNRADSTSTMFDVTTLGVLKQIHAGKSGLDGFMYEDATKKVLTINHSPENPPTPGTIVVIDPQTGDVVATGTTTGSAPEGGVGDGKGRVFINLEDKNAMDVIDTKTWKVVATWPLSPCEGPTGIAMDRAANRIFVGCGKTSLVVDAASGKIVAQITNGDGVDGIAWDQSQKLLYIPSGADGNVTVVHEDSPDKYTTVATVTTMKGARTISVDPKTHTAYVFTPEYGPAPAPAPGSPPPTGRGRGPRGPMLGAWLFAIKH